MVKHFINLTNGIEAIKEYNLSDYSFIRIQSTACEQKRWDFIIQDLDNNFLMNLALGYECIVYDYSAKKETPRAIYQGIEFIRYVLNRYWCGNQAFQVYVKGCNCIRYFDTLYYNLEGKTFKKLYYFKKFLHPDMKCVNIITVSGNTDFDNNFEFYNEVLRNEIKHNK